MGAFEVRQDAFHIMIWPAAHGSEGVECICLNKNVLQKFLYCPGLFLLSLVFVLPCEIENCSFKVYRKLCWNFDGDWFKTIDCFLATWPFSLS